jgi:hypothetical protein
MQGEERPQYSSTGVYWGGGHRDRALLVVSRETGKHLVRQQVLHQSLVLGARWRSLQPAPQRYRELGAFHAQNHSSLRHVPANPKGATALKWAYIHTFLGRQPIGTEVEILIRGIDGLTTAHHGLLQLLWRYRHLSFKFTVLQRRCTIGVAMRPILSPWYPLCHPAVSAAMRTHVFPTFTEGQYRAALRLPLPPQPRGALFVYDLLWLWHLISHGKSSNVHAWFNVNRNSFI